MAKYVSVTVDKNSKHYNTDYLIRLTKHLVKSGLDLTDEIEMKDKIFLDYDAEDLPSFDYFIDDTLKKFPEVKAEFEEGDSSTPDGDIGEYQEYSHLSA